jgi:hypothetical protein
MEILAVIIVGATDLGALGWVCWKMWKAWKEDKR